MLPIKMKKTSSSCGSPNTSRINIAIKNIQNIEMIVILTHTLIAVSNKFVFSGISELLLISNYQIYKSSNKQKKPVRRLFEPEALHISNITPHQS
jgi:hypothetical protein